MHRDGYDDKIYNLAHVAKVSSEQGISGFLPLLEGFLVVRKKSLFGSYPSLSECQASLALIGPFKQPRGSTTKHG